MHDGGLTYTEYSAKFQKGKTVRFLNEVESGPTMYLDARFKHPIEWISFYTQKCVETAYEVTGIPKPEIVEEMKQKVDRAITDGAEKAKMVKTRVLKKRTTAPPQKTTSKKAAVKKAGTSKTVTTKTVKTVKTAPTKTVTKKIAKGKTTKKAAK
jgi:hypothetical protein